MPGALKGLSIIGLATAEAGKRTFHATDARSGEKLEPGFHPASAADLERAALAAERAFDAYAATPCAERAAFLRAIAAELEARGEPIIARADRETALGTARLTGELGRTANQLRLFATLLDEGTWLDVRVDAGDPGRTPAPKPDVRSLRRPLGPVAVFGASNFPLAFSVAGGDTASALAAGCPVVVKAHPAHPGTSELVGRAIRAAAREQGMPDGVFSVLFDDGYEVGRALVRHPLVRAVGFTGSRGGGQALMRLAAERPEPIPVYAEMSSVNPVFVLPQATRRRPGVIADALLASFTQGVGQFCTNPGIVLLEAGEAGDALRDRLVEGARKAEAHAMLTAGIYDAFEGGLKRLAEAGAYQLGVGRRASSLTAASSAVWETDVAATLGDPRLTQEVFGPSTLLVRYRDDEELLAFVGAMEGQLTATLQGEDDEWERYRPLVGALERKVGRLIVNQVPTGVEVCRAMVHGGPYPATSDGRSTSVGARAIERFTRLVAFQNFPKALLPAELR
jgi:NADP-dependent aldehyde dehydrogenase